MTMGTRRGRSGSCEKAGGGVREVVVLSRAGHGMAMLAGEADLGRRLLEWFRRTLL